MRPPLSLFAPTKWFIYLVGGSWTVKVDYSKVGSARRVKMGGHAYWIAGIRMRLLQTLSNVSNQFWNVTNTYWWEGASPLSMRSDAKWPRNLPVAKRLPHSSSRRQGNTCTGVYSPVPPKRPPNGLIHTPSTSMDPHRDGRIKTRAEIVSNIRTRRSAHRAHAAPMRPLRLPSKPTKRSRNIVGRSPILSVRYGKGVSNEIETSTENVSDARTRRYTEYRMKQPNSLPSSPKTPPNGLMTLLGPSGTLADADGSKRNLETLVDPK
ncbi:hypothetical protein EDC04DRAFT_3091391 [Pisolithus marmoratus]|nr:hypothetical protein EDC04DRAFT_3091391 [Pisolithus marmoratus]